MTTTTVGAYEAKTHLPRLLAEVENGGEVVITKHGRPIAKLVPVDRDTDDWQRVLDEIRAFRESLPPIGIPIKELIEEGRRY